MTTTFETLQQEIGLPEKPTKHRYLVVATLFAGIFMAFLDRVNVSILAANVPFLHDMGIQGQPVKVGMLMTIFLFAYGFSNIVITPIVVRRLGPRKTMILCISVWIISLFIGGIASAFALLIVSRVLLGLGEGIYYPLQSVLVKSWIPPQERGRANAIWTIGQSMSPAIAMPLFAYIIALFGWRALFFLCILLNLIPLYMFWAYISDTPKTNKKVNPLELRYIEEGSTSKAETITSKLSFWESVKPFALAYRYWLLVFCYLSMNFIGWGLITWVPAYLSMARGFTWTEMGWLASLPFVAGILFKLLAGWICDRVGKISLIIGVSFFMASMSIYGTAVVNDKYAAALLISAGMGFLAAITPSAWTLLQGMVPSAALATAGGIMNGISTGFAALSPLFIGFMVNLTGSFTTGLFCLVGVGLAGAVSATILNFSRS